MTSSNILKYVVSHDYGNSKVEGHGGIYFWMQRVAEEHTKKAKELISRATLLHWQTINFEGMPENTKNQVIRQLIEDMEILGWHDSIKEYFKNKKEGLQEEKNANDGIPPNSKELGILPTIL